MEAVDPPPDYLPDGRRQDFGRASVSRFDLRCEQWAAFVLWGYLFALIAALAMARSGAAALFLNCHGPRALGAVYVLVALTIAGLVYVLAQLAKSVGQTRIALLTVALAGVGAVAAQLARPTAATGPADPFYLGLYVAVESFAFLAPLQFWTLANSLFDWAGARRRYAFIATGGILGSMAGGAAVRLLNLANPLDLMWPLALLTLPVAVSILVLGRLRNRMPRSRDVTTADLDPSKAHTGRTSAHRVPVPRNGLDAGGQAAGGTQGVEVAARWRGISTRLGLLALLTVATTTLVDFYFKMFADLRYDGHALSLSQFFGNYYLAVGVATLALQMFVTPAALRWRGPFGGLLLMPLALGAVALTNLLTPTLLGAVVLKLVDSSFSHSVQRSCREVLYTAIPASVVGGVQAVADGIWGRMGLLVCGVVLMVLGPYVGLSTWLAIISAIVFLWLSSVWIVYQAYQNQLFLRQVPPSYAPWQRVQPARSNAPLRAASR